MKGKTIKIKIYGMFDQRIKSNKFYMLVEITKSKKVQVSPIFQGKDYSQYVSIHLQDRQYEIQRIRCKKASHELNLPVHAVG